MRKGARLIQIDILLSYFAYRFLLPREDFLLVTVDNLPGMFDARLDASDLAHFG
jgi:hypothetical protein